jgi:hypothetical protein
MTRPKTDRDIWARFERAVDVVAKSPPQHKTKGKSKASQKKAKKAQETKAS